MEQAMKAEGTVRGEKAEKALGALFDEGTFSPLGVSRQGRGACARGDETESLITGYGAVEGRCVFAFVQDGQTSGGVMTAETIVLMTRALALAVKSRAPMVGVFSSIGMETGSGTAPIAAMAGLMKQVREASKVIPLIAVVDGCCLGMCATLAAMFDLTVMRDTATLSVTPPSLLKAKDPHFLGYGSADYAKKQGNVAMVSHDPMADVRRLLAFLPSSVQDGGVILENGDDINLPRTVDCRGPMATVMEELCDKGCVMRLYEGFEGDSLYALGAIGGRVCGIVGGLGKGLTARGSRQSAAFLFLCEKLRLPILTLVDYTGVAADATQEGEMAEALARLAGAYADLTVARVTLLVRAAYGAAYGLMGSAALGGEIVFASEHALIGPLSPEAGVELTCRAALHAGRSRSELEEEYRQTRMDPRLGARAGEIDMILPPDQLRTRICAAFEMLSLGEGV